MKAGTALSHLPAPPAFPRAGGELVVNRKERVHPLREDAGVVEALAAVERGDGGEVVGRELEA